MTPYVNVTVSNVTVPTVTEATAEFLAGEFMAEKVAAWVHLVILILGLITNPMILIVLRRKQFGSKYYFFNNA